MIIISKRKDFYDYLTGIYGIDEKKVLRRIPDITGDEMFYTKSHQEDVKSYLTDGRNLRRFGLFLDDCVFNIYIANKMYRVLRVSKDKYEPMMFHKTYTDFYGNRQTRAAYKITDKENYTYFIPTEKNKLSRKPIAISYARDIYRKGIFDETPILSTFGLTGILDAVEVYSEIDMFLGWLNDNPCNIKELEDKDKIVAHGFDKRVSFRHRK